MKIFSSFVSKVFLIFCRSLEISLVRLFSSRMTLQICSKVLSSSNELKSNSNNISTLHKMYVSYTIDFCVKFRLSNDLTLKLLHLSTTISYGKNYDRKSVRKKTKEN